MKKAMNAEVLVVKILKFKKSLIGEVAFLLFIYIFR